MSTKKYYEIIETTSNGDVYILFEDSKKQKANVFFNGQLTVNGSKPQDMTSLKIELWEIEKEEDGYVQDVHLIQSQFLYNEGTIDRNNSMGEHAENYGFVAIWDAKKRDSLYTFFFMDDEQPEKIYEKDLKNWYNNTDILA